MARLRLYQVDAFSDRLFGGNPAAVVLLPAWLDVGLMQSIAAENNLSETAFCVEEGDHYGLRWFTPTAEVKLCGHATLATAHVLFTETGVNKAELAFTTASGTLRVCRAGAGLVMDFPRWELARVAVFPSALTDGLGRVPQEVLMTSSQDNLFAIFDHESDILALKPDMTRLASLHPAGVVVTAPGTDSDCVCRYFAPSYGVDEDPGTGSIHCGLAPLWSGRLGKSKIISMQLSPRGARLHCELKGARTFITGEAVTYLEGWIRI